MTSLTRMGTLAVDDDSHAGHPWSDPTNVYASDNAYATCALGGFGGGSTHYLKVTGFGFSLPSDAVINGIVVGVECHKDIGELSDSHAQLVKGNVIQPTDQPNGAWAASDTVIDHGGVTDLWGNTWAPADINSSTFGFALVAVYVSGGAGAFVDCISITVYFTAPEPQPMPPCPYLPSIIHPLVGAFTGRWGFPDILDYEIRLGSNGSLGASQIIVPDPAGLIFDQVSDEDRIVTILRQGPVEKRYTGIVTSRSQVVSPRRSVPLLKIGIKGYGEYLRRRNKPTDYSATSIQNIMMSSATGLCLAVPELEWGPYIAGPGTTISTTGKKRSILSDMNELMLRAGTATNPYVYWVDHGQDAMETKENVHFRPRIMTPVPIVVSTDQLFSFERISTVQFLANQIEVEYGAAGLTTIRDDSASQTIHGVVYDYSYAPFLTLLADAQGWGDNWLSRSATTMKAISMTMPANLLIEPNYMIRVIGKTWDRYYETGMVMHRGSTLRSPPEAVTIVEAATTLA